ncbi:hypothetical protein EUBIFOR_00771 [Holdemanella biformis DSM 3989]|uniref:Uncharacterized protein n=1 Tax=Holdemanella biformis DSM 3989 TaxID=518637 RepID=B7C9B5_9FIRM|nr:hypothetical protein EUBIFOR_00771 [Holdemanella biformis DSM 3989]
MTDSNSPVCLSGWRCWHSLRSIRHLWKVGSIHQLSRLHFFLYCYSYICCSSDTSVTLHILRRFQITELIIIILLIFHYCKFIFCFRVTYFLCDHLCKHFFCVLITVKIYSDVDNFLLHCHCKTSIFCKKRAANPFLQINCPDCWLHILKFLY